MIAAAGLGLVFLGFLVFFIALPFTISLAANDVYATGAVGRYAERLVHLAARRIPVPDRDRRLQDWLADLDTTSAQLLKLWYALNILVASGAVAAAVRSRSQHRIGLSEEAILERARATARRALIVIVPATGIGSVDAILRGTWSWSTTFFVLVLVIINVVYVMAIRRLSRLGQLKNTRRPDS